MDLAEILAMISPEMAEISSYLKNFAKKCSISQFDWVSLGFGEKTCQPTRRFRVLKAKTHS